MSSLPTVSIITPSYQQARFIEANILSVREQNYPGLEHIVVDGGSSDGTVDILRKYDLGVRWISEKDWGQADAINKGAAQTTGEIIGWLNSDDTYAPGAILAAAEMFEAHPEAGVIYGDANFINAEGKIVLPCAHVEPFDRLRLLNYTDFLVQPAVFFRRIVFEAVGGVDSRLRWAMDYDLWLKLAQETQFAYLQRVLANYRWTKTSKTNLGGEERLREIEMVVRRHGGKGLPGNFRLEAVRMYLTEAALEAKRGRIDQSAIRVAKAAGMVLGSSRAMRSLMSRKTWKIIYTGQVLRNRTRLVV